MKKIVTGVSAALFFVLVLSPLGAQQNGEGRKDRPKGPEGPPPEGKRKEGPDGGERKGPPPPKEGKEGERPEAKCGKELGSCLDEIRKRKDVDHEALEGITRDHFRIFHPDGRCHCECGHKGPPRDGDGERKPDKKCGRDPGALGDYLKKRKDLGDDDVDRKVKEHFRVCHPDCECHCFCHHDEGSKGDGPRGDGSKDPGSKDGGGKDSRKGNNGVGNGVDPQPPGKPPVNDGPGTGPGNPGNKKGGGEGRK